MSDMSLSEVLPGLPPDPSNGRRRGSDRLQRKRKKRRRRRSFVVMLLAVAIVGGSVAGAYVLGLAPLIQRLTAPKDYTGQGAGTVQVKIPDGATGRSIARVLVASDVVKTQVAFLDAAAKDPRSASIQPGTYELRRQMSGASALALLLDSKTRRTVSVTIPEGKRAAEVVTLVAKGLKLKPAAVKKAMYSGDIGLPKAAKGRPEGFLFPDTYSFPPDVTVQDPHLGVLVVDVHEPDARRTDAKVLPPHAERDGPLHVVRRLQELVP